MSQHLRYRGYITSRPFAGERVPQHVQNLVIRNYCKENDFEFLLSSTEVVMPGAYMLLESLLDQLADIDGIVFYSMFQLPPQKDNRVRIYDKTIDNGKSIHFAVEGLSISNLADRARLENILAVKESISKALDATDLRKYVRYPSI